MWVGRIQSVDGLKRKKTDFPGRRRSADRSPDWNCHASSPIGLPLQTVDVLGSPEWTSSLESLSVLLSSVLTSFLSRLSSWGTKKAASCSKLLSKLSKP